MPQLRGINQTAPCFHDHRARTLEEVAVLRGLPLPLIADEDIAPIVACMRKAF
jgi:hypothetical protein